MARSSGFARLKPDRAELLHWNALPRGVGAGFGGLDRGPHGVAGSEVEVGGRGRGDVGGDRERPGQLPASVTVFMVAGDAEANTSAGAPWLIWVARAELPAKLNV